MTASWRDCIRCNEPMAADIQRAANVCDACWLARSNQTGRLATAVHAVATLRRIAP